MAIYTLQRTQRVTATLDECWSFFSDARNLSKITPPALDFRIKTDLPAKVYPGLMIQYTVSPLLGIPVSWLTEIVQVRAPFYFADEQRVGPYRVWHHEHFFAEVGGGQVDMRDLIHYVPPFGPLGAILNMLVIRPQLERIFAYREQILRTMKFGAAAS